MEIDIEKVKKAGTKHYPDVAKEFASLAKVIEDCLIEERGNRSDLEQKASQIVGFLVRAASESSNYLEDCGELLVKMTEEYDFVDGENAYNIEKPSHGFEEEV